MPIKLPKGFTEVGEIRLRDYQKEAILFGMLHNNAGLLLGLGLGKTLTAITIARYRIQHDKVKKVLVVCPSSILENWRLAIEAHSEYEGLILNVNDKEERLYRALLKKPHFHIINYESLFPLLRDLGAVRKIKQKDRTRFVFAGDELLEKKLGYSMLIFDESAKFLKHHTSSRTKCSIILSEFAKYKLILTGTLIGDKPMNVWSQFMVLDNGKSFGRNFYKFRNHYFEIINMGKYQQYIFKKQFVREFQQKIYTTCIRFTKDEPEVAKELPETIHHTIKIPLEGKLKDIYEEVVEQIITEIETTEGTTILTVENILTRLIRLQQITSGFASEGTGQEKKLKYTPKLDALIEEIETINESRESVVVWCRFTKSIDIISEALTKRKDPIKHLILDGRVTNAKKKYAIWKKFQESKIPVFIGQIESGGIGIELFKKDFDAKYQHTIMYENTWSLDTRDQAEGRTHRQGQKSICRYVDLIVEKTIDERIYKALKSKKEISQMIMERNLRGFLKGDYHDTTKKN